MFPTSLRTICQSAFFSCKCLRTVALNEGLTVLGTHETQGRSTNFSGVFERSALSRVSLPSTLKVIEHGAFMDCTNLTAVRLPKGLERIEEFAFCSSGIMEIQIPSTLRELDESPFHFCRLHTAWVEEGCSCDIRHYLGRSVHVISTRNGTFGGRPLWELRALRDVVLPDGITSIGNYWFSGSGIESVAVPAGVLQIGIESFYNCSRLKMVAFAKDCRLQTVGEACFSGSALEKINIPSSVRTIGDCAFCRCKALRSVYFCAGCELQCIGQRCFYESGLEQITLPATLREMGQGALCGCLGLRAIWVEDGCSVSVRKYADTSATILPAK